MSKMSERHDDLHTVFVALCESLVINETGRRTATSFEDTLTANKWDQRLQAIEALIQNLIERGVDVPDWVILNELKPVVSLHVVGQSYPARLEAANSLADD